MANNRLWAVCKDDNEATCIVKYYPGPPSWGGGWNNKEDFFLKHDNCPSNEGCGENILFCHEQEDKRVKLYDFTKQHEGITKIYFNE